MELRQGFTSQTCCPWYYLYRCNVPAALGRLEEGTPLLGRQALLQSKEVDRDK